MARNLLQPTYRLWLRGWHRYVSIHRACSNTDIVIVVPSCSLRPLQVVFVDQHIPTSKNIWRSRSANGKSSEVDAGSFDSSNPLTRRMDGSWCHPGRRYGIMLHGGCAFTFFSTPLGLTRSSAYVLSTDRFEFVNLFVAHHHSTKLAQWFPHSSPRRHCPYFARIARRSRALCCGQPLQ